MADHPLRPATDRNLGKPLPYQLANQPQAPPQAPEGFGDEALPPPQHAVLTSVSRGCSPLRGRLLTCYSPVCHCFDKIKTVRLACIMHAASVYPEPGSNSQNIKRLFNCLFCKKPSFRYPVVKVRFMYKVYYHNTTILSTECR